jgi:hypothetical protein
MAPPTFMQMTKSAWDYYAQTVLNDRKLEFLLLCNNAKWKLRTWSVNAYSCWTGNHGLRKKKLKGKKEPIEDALNDSNLLCMDPEEDSKDSKSLNVRSHSVDGVNNMVRLSMHHPYMCSPFYH